MKYKCGFVGCGKWFKIKRTHDTHESSHQMSVSTDSKVHFVCEHCNQMFDALDKLKIHKLTHSKTKKYVCHVCKQHGYTRASDRNNHEVKCCDDHKCEIVDGIVVPLPPTEIYLYLLHHQNLQTLLTKDPRLGLKKFFFCLIVMLLRTGNQMNRWKLFFLVILKMGRINHQLLASLFQDNAKTG